MKFISIPVILLLLFWAPCDGIAQNQGNSDSNSLEYHTLPEAVEKAARDNKKVLIDIYTDWCGYCRRMLSETYADAGVIKAVNDYFYVVRLDAESDEEVTFEGETFTKQELAYGLGATGYPTTVFLNQDGSPLASQPGFFEADIFEKLLVYVGTEAYNHTPFDEFSLD